MLGENRGGISLLKCAELKFNITLIKLKVKALLIKKQKQKITIWIIIFNISVKAEIKQWDNCSVNLLQLQCDNLLCNMIPLSLNFIITRNTN